MLIDGKKLADAILNQLVGAGFPRPHQPTLAILQIGNNPESNAYINQKKRVGERVGVKVVHIKFQASVSELEIIKKIKQLNSNKEINGIILQLPIPKPLNTDKILSSISSQKDVDGFLPNSPYTPPIACAILAILKHIRQLPITNYKLQIIIIGRGITGGTPIAQTFNKLKIPYTQVHSKTKNSHKITKKADVIISCVGKPNIITPKNISRGVGLISVGIHTGADGKLHGDYNEEAIKNIASFYTPTPGGVGPLTVACLMKNVIYSHYDVPRVPSLTED